MEKKYQSRYPQIGSRESLSFQEAVRGMVNGMRHLASLGFQTTDAYLDGKVSSMTFGTIGREDFESDRTRDYLLEKIAREGGIFKRTSREWPCIGDDLTKTLTTGMVRDDYKVFFAVEDTAILGRIASNKYFQGVLSPFLGGIQLFYPFPNKFAVAYIILLEKERIEPVDEAKFNEIKASLEDAVQQKEPITS